MKRFLISIFTLCIGSICLHAQIGEFDPANPGDPQPFYILQVQVSPAAGGTVNVARTLLAEGQQVTLHVTPKENFRLEQWVCDEEVLSADTYLSYTMPARNVTITAQMVYEPDVFDPESPGDPVGQGDNAHRHKVTIYSSPSIGGYTNQSLFYMQEGERCNLYAYNNAGYEFAGWYVGERLESHTNPVVLTMFADDITLTARFQFNPASPEDPGANLYDAATGTLIVDRFTAGRLSDVVYSLVGFENYNNVHSLTVVGEMNASDYGIVSNFSNLEILDFSRTIGYNTVPSWAFSNNSHLRRILLPASLETIGDNAFNGCSALSEIVLYAPAPPTAQQSASTLFSEVSGELIVRVPAASVSLYRASALWNTFNILPMDVMALNVTLPEDKVALYEDMFLELLDTKSGQLFRYVITQRNRYAFTTVFDGTTYQLTLRNAHNKIFGQEMVTFAGNDTTVSFTSLKQPIDISLHVLDTAGNDVTEHTTIKWYDNENTYASEGKDLSKQLEGDILIYHIQLDASLATTYVEPKDSNYIVNLNNNRIIYALRAMPSVSLIGLVRDSVTKRPVSNASVSVKQIIQGKYNKLFTTETDADGNFVIKVMDVNNTIVTISADNYAKKSFETEQLHDDLHIDLRPFRGVTLNLRLQYSEAVEDTIQAVYRDIYSDYSDFQFVIRNTTQNKWINDYTYNYPLIQIKEDINPSDEIELTVRSANGIFVPYTTSVTINNLHQADAVLQLVESGSITASYVYAPTDVVRAMLFNSAGNLIKNELYGNDSIRFDHLIAGQYTLVSIVNNDRLRSIVRLSDISRFGLQTTDYVQSIVTVSNGYISREQIDSIPNYEELASYLQEGSSFSGNKSSLVVGDYLTLRSNIDFLPQYKNAVSNVELVVVLPQTVQLVENAVMVGSIIGGYNVNGQEISIPIENYNDLVRFCVIPSAEGTFQTSAYVRFISEGKVHNQPLGAASFNVENAKIAAYINYFKDQIIASGMATPYSDIELYDNDELIGAIKAKPDGLWQIEADMPYVYNLSKHKVYAKITTPLGISMVTKAKNLLYNISNLSTLKTIEMRVYEQGQLHADVIWDYVNAKVTPNSYQYTAAESSFEFIVDFSDSINSQIEGVDLVLYMHDEQRTLPLGYDQTINKWKGSIGKGMIGERGNGIINVGVQIYANSEFSEDDYLLDSEWLHDMLESNNQTQVLETAEVEDDIIAHILAAIEQDNLSLATYLLDSLESDISIDGGEMTEFEIQQLLANNDSIINQYSLDVFFTDLQAAQDSLASLMNGVSIGNCGGLNPEDLSGEGYTMFPKTNGGNLYVFSSEELWKVIDFDENIYYVVDLQSNGELAQCMRRVINATEENDFIKFFEEANKAYQKFNDMVQAIAGVITSSQQALTNQNKAIRQQQGDLKKAYINCQGRPNLQKAVVQTRALNHVKLQTNHSQLTSIGRFKALQTGPGFSILAVAGTFLNGINDGYELYRLYQSIMPCPDDQAKAIQIRNEIASFGKKAGIYYVAQIGVGIAQLVIFNTSVGASFFTGGTSLVVAGVAIGVVVATYIASVAYGEIFDAKIKDYRNRKNALKCHKDPEPEEPQTVIEPIFPDCQAHIDPSGFVYEGVEDNRVEGVKAVVYYKETRENMFGEPVEEDIMWNAWDYDQENPQYTDAEGKYQWFVPQGLWQVRFEKEGYELTQSEWLPVPPPQLEVNIPIVQLRQPEVINAIAHKDAIDITFDKYMMPSLLNTDNVFVTANGQLIAGIVTLLDEQHSYGDNSETYASKIRFVPEEEFNASEITLTVSNRVRSYADVPMTQTFQQTFDVDDIGMLEHVQIPSPSVVSGTQIENGAELIISCATEGAVIRYTMDGSIPDCLYGYVYSNVPIRLYGQQSVTINAIACAEGYEPSEVAQWIYYIDNVSTDAQNTNFSSPKPVKLLKNGHLYILMPNGNKYTIFGQAVR